MKPEKAQEIIEFRREQDVAQTEIDIQEDTVTLHVPEDFQEAQRMYAKDPILNHVVKTIADATEQERMAILGRELDGSFEVGFSELGLE